MYEIRRWFFITGVRAENSLLTAMENLQFNIKFETSYVSLAQVVAVQSEVNESWE